MQFLEAVRLTLYSVETKELLYTLFKDKVYLKESQHTEGASQEGATEAGLNEGETTFWM